MPPPPSSGLPCPSVRRSESIQNQKDIKPTNNTTDVEYTLTRITVPAYQTADTPRPSTSEEQIEKGTSRYSVESGFHFTEYRDPTLEILATESDRNICKSRLTSMSRVRLV